jgi:hypothetical protein
LAIFVGAVFGRVSKQTLQKAIRTGGELAAPVRTVGQKRKRGAHRGVAGARRAAFSA